MPIAYNVTYKCKKCNYKFTRLESDCCFFPRQCPKCGGDTEIISSSPGGISGIDLIFKILKIFFKK
jgi:Zn finger protein HypA/HybF involved in hydrogenase expression